MISLDNHFLSLRCFFFPSFSGCHVLIFLICVRILVCLHSSKGIQSLSHFQVTYNQLQSFVIQTSSTIYISLAESCLFFFFLVTYIRLRNLVTQALSVIYICLGILSLSHFLVTYIHLRNLVTQASLVIYIRLGGILSLSHFFWRLTSI